MKEEKTTVHDGITSKMLRGMASDGIRTLLKKVKHGTEKEY